MKNLQQYNMFIQRLEPKAKGGLFFHYINHQIYITDFTARLLGVWDTHHGQSLNWKKK